MVVTIRTEKRSRDWDQKERSDDFRAFIKGEYLVYGSGRTILEAIGDLVYHNKEKFNIEVEA